MAGVLDLNVNQFHKCFLSSSSSEPQKMYNTTASQTVTQISFVLDVWLLFSSTKSKIAFSILFYFGDKKDLFSMNLRILQCLVTPVLIKRAIVAVRAAISQGLEHKTDISSK